MTKFYVVYNESKKVVTLVCVTYRMAFEQLIRVRKISEDTYKIGILYR
jgi:hypothetical protein